MTPMTEADGGQHDRVMTVRRSCSGLAIRPEAHVGLDRVQLASGDASRADEHAVLGLAIARELELRIIECRSLSALAAVTRATGRPTAAARHTAQANQIQRDTGYHPPR
jgi:hypothetical protein